MPKPTEIDKLPRMPFHFIPQEAPHLSRQILFASQAFAKVDLDTALNEALEKFTEQSEKNLPKPEDITEVEVASFLGSETRKTDEFKALKNEYTKLQNLRDNQRSITPYVQSAQTLTQNIHKKFAEYLKKEKEVFHKAYATVCPDEEKRKALWEMYAKNLRVNMQEPLEQFTKDINGLVPQALTHYVNQLGKKNSSSMEYQTGKTKEELERRLQYEDSNGMPITIIKDKETGEPSEIRVNPLSSTWFGFNAKSGDLGDGYTIVAAYYRKDVPIKVAVPIAENNINATEMDPGLLQIIVSFIAMLFRKLEENHYKEQAVKAASEKGISLNNISLIDTQGNPLVHSHKIMAAVTAKLNEWENNFTKEEEELTSHSNRSRCV